MENITVEELKALMDQSKVIHLIDVREPEERKEFNIGGKLIPLGRFKEFDVDELEPLKNEEIILYCRSGKRSAQAGAILETMGFTKVKNMVGGVLRWKEVFGDK